MLWFSFTCLPSLQLKIYALTLASLKVSEMFKWIGKEAHACISDMFNYAFQHGMPYDWTTSWIKPLHKGGDVNNANNYLTVMVGSLMAKHFGCTKISAWAEKYGKRAYGC